MPQQALYSAVLLRAALESAGIAVRDPSRVGAPSAHAKAPLALLARHESAPRAVAGADGVTTNAGGGEKKPEPIRNRGDKVGRNDPCPCGSGKKYKNCHMRATA